MTGEDFAKAIMDSIARHQSRGLIYSEGGMDEVVMHGRVDMLAVADEVMALCAVSPPMRSWAPWFAQAVCSRRGRAVARTGRHKRESKPEAGAPIDAAIARLRMRAPESEEDESPPADFARN